MKKAIDAAGEAAATSKKKTPTQQAPQKAKSTQPLEMRKVTVNLSPKHLAIFQGFSSKFQVPLNALLAHEAYCESECLSDGVLQVLGWIEKASPRARTVPVVMEICPELHLVFSELCRILRRTVTEMISGFLAIAANQIEHATEEAENECDFRECFWTASHSREFEEAASENRILMTATKANDVWSLFELQRPDGKEAA